MPTFNNVLVNTMTVKFGHVPPKSGSPILYMPGRQVLRHEKNDV